MLDPVLCTNLNWQEAGCDSVYVRFALFDGSSCQGGFAPWTPGLTAFLRKIRDDNFSVRWPLTEELLRKFGDEFRKFLVGILHQALEQCTG